MQKWALGYVAFSLLLSGCSVFKTDTSTPETIKQINLQIPDGLAKPNQPANFDIPVVSIDTTQRVDSRSPSLVLATAVSSRLEEEETLARVWFERNELTGELLPFVVEQVKGYFSEQAINLEQIDDEGLVFHTDWLSRTETSGFWFWKNETTTEQSRFKLTLAPRPHGRSLSLTVTLLEQRSFREGETQNFLDIKAAEVSMLNQLINQVAITEALITRERRQNTPQVSLEPGLDTDGNAVFISSQPVDVVWSQFELLFPELNLTVNDLDRSIYTYFLSYTKPKRGFWRTVTFQSAPLTLPLTDGEYQIQLSRSSTAGTIITWRNPAGVVLSPETVNALHQPLLQAISESGAEF